MAREQFNRLSKLYADTPEGLTAQLAEAQLERDAGRFDRALDDYRAVLDAVVDPTQYVNPLVSLSALRRILLEAHQQFINERLFAEAQTLVDQLDPIFHATEQRELRTETHKSWGDALKEEADRKGHWAAARTMREGRYQYRAAGRV